MGVFSCCNSAFKSLSRAAAKSAGERMRRMGLLSVSDDWRRRTDLCVRCPMCVTRNGIAYCGRPFVEKIHRNPVTDGCGCPCLAKARDPAEHCPVDRHLFPALRLGQHCNCKWCQGSTQE